MHSIISTFELEIGYFVIMEMPVLPKRYKKVFYQNQRSSVGWLGRHREKM